jgi:solute carrier family 39 (zinc transporter), member 1/2/3
VDLFTFRLIAIVAILLMGLFGGFLPMWVGYSPRTQRFFSLGNALSAGIFLSAGLIHMLPDAEHNLRGVLGEFPTASLIAVLGFFIVLFVERVVSQAEAKAEAEGGAAGRGAVYAYILALVLSIHAFIAGVALGTEQTVAGLAVLFIAIIAHKGSEAFALGISMFRGGVARARIPRTVVTLAMMTPLGIVTGSLLSAGLTGHAALLVEGIFDALAAGTFIYVSILDVIGEEFALPGDRLAKFVLAALGSAAMAILGIWS